MRHLTTGALVAVALFLSASLASADIIRTATTYGSSTEVLGLSDTVAVDVYLDCECAGGAADASGYLIVQMVMAFDDSILSYDPGLSSPSGGGLPTPATEPGIVIFGSETGNRNLLIAATAGGNYGDSYYSATGGPHNQIGDAGNGDSQVLMFYSAKGLTTGAGSRAGGEWYIGTLVFHVVGLGAPTPLQIKQPDGEAWMASLSADRGNGFLSDADIAIDGPIVVHTPEPTTALLLGLGLVGLGVAGRRRA